MNIRSQIHYILWSAEGFRIMFRVNSKSRNRCYFGNMVIFCFTGIPFGRDDCAWILSLIGIGELFH